MGENYRHIGKPTPRKDARDIVTGRAKYIDDVKMQGMLYGKVLRSPHAHARVKEIDTTIAERCPGVAAVLTYKNVPDWKAGVPYHRLVLDRTLRFVGDAVALVAAETETAAEEALDMIQVEYEILPAVYDVEEATKPGTVQIHEKIKGNVYPRTYPSIGPNILQELVMGNVEEGFKDADFIAEGTCSYENIPNPLPPEPPGVIASWEDPEHITIYTASQSAAMNRNFAQPALGLVDVRAISTQCGGSYGTKNANFIPMAHAAALARVTGRPVKVYFNKDEHFGAYSLRLGSRLHAKVGIKKDGSVTALTGDWYVDTGAASEMAQVQIMIGLGEAQLLVRCPNWNLQSKLVCTNRSPSGVVRGFGGHELKSTLIPILSLAMEQAQLDPLQFYLKNFVKKGDGYYWRDCTWWNYRGIDYSNVMKRGAEVFGWKEKWKGWGIPTSVSGTKRRGVGVGVHGNADIGEDESEAWVKISADSRAVLHCCVSEAGMGQRSAVCKMVAEVLNIGLDRVTITDPDTKVNPFEFGLVGSRGTFAVGSAVIEAAVDAKKKLFEFAAPVLGVKSDELETRDGQINVIGSPEKKIPWRKAMGIMRTITGMGRHEANYSLCNFMMIFAEIEVDTETGKIDIVRIVAATDCGQIIDPLVLEGQLNGSFGSGGTDSAIFEETVLDKDIGRILNCNMIDYKWRTFEDFPEFKSVILETPIPSHLFNAVGVGEIATAPGPPAVMMAVYNAIGKRIMEYPLTPDKVLKALGREEAK